MRFAPIHLLTVALILFGASNASAFAFNLVQNSGPGTGTAVVPSDVITFDVYVDADPGAQFLNACVLYDNDGFLVYNPGASSGPTYILYTGGKGSTVMYPAGDQLKIWAGLNQPGKKQVQVNFISNGFGPVAASGTNIFMGNLVFHVVGGADNSSTVQMALLTNGSTVVQANNTLLNGTGFQGTIPTNGSFTFAPEPSAALLAGIALSTVAVIRARRRRA